MASGVGRGPAGGGREPLTEELLARVRAALRNDPEVDLVDEMLLQVAPAKLTLAQWRASLALTVTEVLAPQGEVVHAESA